MNGPYHVMKDGQRTGPFTVEAIAEKAASGQIGREDWVAAAGQPWQHAHEAMPALFPKEVPPEVARALATAAEKFGVGKKAVGKVGVHVAGVAARLGVDTHMIKGLDKLSSAAQSILRGTAERNPRLARELAEQFDANKKNLVAAFSYTVFGLIKVVGVVLLLDLGLAIRAHSGLKFVEELLGPLGVFILLLVGVAVAAVRCLWWMFRDEFKAVAIGRKVFLVWILVSAVHTFRVNMPKATVSAPVASIVARERRQLPAAGSKVPAGPREVLIVDGATAEVGQLTWKDWAKGPVKESVEDVWGNYIILALLTTIYNQLRGLRPSFSWAHFINVVSFGLWFRFTDYDFETVEDDIDPTQEDGSAPLAPA